VDPQLFALISLALAAVASALLGLILREQISLRQRVGKIETSEARIAVYLSLLCDHAGIHYTGE